MKTFLRELVFAALAGVLCLPINPGHCAVPSPGTEFHDAGDTTYIYTKETKDDGTNFLGEIKKDQKLLIVRRGKQADLTLYVNGRLLYTMPDEDIDVSSEHFDPGETYNAYSFYLSPDHLNLLVVRGLERSLAVAYLYTRSGPGRMRAVRPGGLRLDEAALHYYCQRKAVDEDLLGSAARNIRFVQWDAAQHRLIFTMHSASYWAGGPPHRGDVSALWYTAYDLKTGRFRIITHTQGLPEPQDG